MKEETKRIKNDDFEQTNKCYLCHKLFWAKSIYELGNWENFCKTCSRKNTKELENQEENIKKYGTKIYSAGGQIKGWILKKDKIYNPEYKPENIKETELMANGFIDL